MNYVLRLGMKVWSDHVIHIKFEIAIYQNTSFYQKWTYP